MRIGFTMVRIVVCLLLLVYFPGEAQRQSPQPSVVFDLKPYGFLVTRSTQNNTTLGFSSDKRIGVHIDQCQISAKCEDSLLSIDLQESKILSHATDFPNPVIFLSGGNILYFEARRLDLYSPDLKLMASHSSVTGQPLNFAARSRLVALSPDGLSVAIPTGDGSEILATGDLRVLHKTQGAILALGEDRWFLKKRLSEMTEQIYSNNTVKDVRQIALHKCGIEPFYLTSQLVLMSTCDDYLTVSDNNGHLRYRLKVHGELAVLPDSTGNHFLSEVYVMKTLDFSGTAQYKKIVVQVFQTDSGKELFHMEDVPSDKEPTWAHYVALSPSGRRLAVMRDGILKVYDVAH
jgi:hypothetical protein